MFMKDEVKGYELCEMQKGMKVNHEICEYDE